MQLRGQSNRILVAGVYLADEPNNVAAISRSLNSSTSLSVTQCWAAVGVSERDAVQPMLRVSDSKPKFVLINALLAIIDIASFEYVIVCDDDISLPPGLLDEFIPLQRKLDFRLAQPARTRNSHIEHAIVCEQKCVARETLFVECGPLFSMHHSILELLVPFDLESPMGWGYEFVWAWRLSQRGLRMGIVDSVAVEHSMRAPGSAYSREEARRCQQRLLSLHPHYPESFCTRTLRFYSYD